MLGVLLILSWLLTTALAGAAGWVALVHHRQFSRSPGAFRCRLRVVRGSLHGVGPEWRRSAGWACWTHDVLLFRPGLLPLPTHVLQVRFPEGSVEPLPASAPQGLGTGPVVLRLRLDDGALVDVAAAATDRELLPGPFLVACVDEGNVGTKRRPPSR